AARHGERSERGGEPVSSDPVGRRTALGLGVGVGLSALAGLAGCASHPAPTAAPAPAAAPPAPPAPRQPGAAGTPRVPGRRPGAAGGPGVEVANGLRPRREVALTFHGAGDPALARQVLAAAEAAGARITVLAVGTWLAANPDLARRIVG